MNKYIRTCINKRTSMQSISATAGLRRSGSARLREFLVSGPALSASALRNSALQATTTATPRSTAGRATYRGMNINLTELEASAIFINVP